MKETVDRIARDSFVYIPEQVQRQLMNDADHVRMRRGGGARTHSKKMSLKMKT
jgi:hypothetical protein